MPSRRRGARTPATAAGPPAQPRASTSFPSSPSVVDTVDACRQAVEVLASEAQVAVKVEGVHLCRKGRVSIVLICSPAGYTYCFDITTLQARAFEEGGLRRLLESSRILKVIFDGRSSNDALSHLYGVTMSKVYDVQVLRAFRFSAPGNNHVDGLAKCVQQSEVLPAAQLQQFKSIKAEGRLLFAPECGGAELVWEERPLRPELLDWSMVDVELLLPLKRAWERPELQLVVEDRSIARIHAAIEHSQPAKGKHLALRDFSLDTTEVGSASAWEIPTECPICMQVLSTGDAADEAVRSLPCGHQFHEACIADHIRAVMQGDNGVAPQCPVCREPFHSYARALGISMRSQYGSPAAPWVTPPNPGALPRPLRYYPFR